MKKSLTTLQCVVIWNKYFAEDTQDLFNLKREVKTTELRHDNSSMMAYDGQCVITCKGMRINQFVNHVRKNGMINFVVFDNTMKLFTVYKNDYEVQAGLLQLPQKSIYNYLYSALKVKMKNKWINNARTRLVSYNREYHNLNTMIDILTLWGRAYEKERLSVHRTRINDAGEKEWLFSQYTIKDEKGVRILPSAYDVA